MLIVLTGRNVKEFALVVEFSEHFTDAELREIGFHQVGSDVKVSRKASFYGVSGTIGDNTRIDDFCIIKGEVHIGAFVHIAAFCSVSGVAGCVTFGDCSTIAPRVSIFTASDDYHLPVLNNPLVPDEYKNVAAGDVSLGAGALVGAHSVILPNVSIGDGASIGAMVVVHVSVAAGDVCINRSAKVTVVRNRDANCILKLVKSFRRTLVGQ